MDAISITRENRCSDRLDESTGSHEDNTSLSFDRTILQQTRQRLAAEEELGHDEPWEMEHTEEDNIAFWLVGADTL